MEIEDSPAPKSGVQTTITPAQRIHELLAIDKDIAQTLHAGSQAIRSLTLSPPTPSKETAPDSDTPADDAANKRAFETHARAFFNNVQGVTARLRRQAYALEEAGIITADTSSLEEKPLQTSPQQGEGSGMNRQGALRPGPSNQDRPPAMQITNGGLGNFDVGWLNSRRDEVGKQKEAELWAEAKAFVKKLEGMQQTASSMTDGEMDLDDDADKT